MNSHDKKYLQSQTERAAQTAAVFKQAIIESRKWISADDRVGLDDGAWLLGYDKKSFRNLVRRDGPYVYCVGGGGHQKTVKLVDLALWLEDRRT